MAAETDLHIQRLKEAIEKAEELRVQGVSTYTPAWKAWHDRTMQSLRVTGLADYARRFDSLAFKEPYESSDSRLWESEPGTFDEDFRLAQEIIRDALEDLSVRTATPPPATPVATLLETAASLARFMLENGYFHEKWISRGDLAARLGIAPENFGAADSYLLQKGYTKGTLGPDGSRWLTASGVDFAEATAKKRGLPLDVAIEAQRLYDPNLGTVTTRKEAVKENKDPRRVFVVHGRNEKIRSGFFNFLRALGLNPIEWSEAIASTRKASPYTGEALEKALQSASAVVVLLTPDDEVRLSEELWSPGETDDEKSYQRQARPNVLFEAGMAFGKDPDRTLLIEVGLVKRFSDVGGRHVVRLSNASEKRHDVVSRLARAGCVVTTTGNDWLTAGDFDLRPPETSADDPPRSVEKATERLSVFAREILREGAEDDRRTILAVPTGRGLLIQANGKRWAAENARDEAERAADLRSLERMGLIEKYRENSYQVTSKGFRVAGESPTAG